MIEAKLLLNSSMKEGNSHISFFYNEDLQDTLNINAHINQSM